MGTSDSMAQALSQSDVKRLLKDPSGKNRAVTAGKVASDYKSGALTDQERKIAEDIFGIMVRDTELRVRKALSENLKDSVDMPTTSNRCRCRSSSSPRSCPTRT